MDVLARANASVTIFTKTGTLSAANFATDAFSVTQQFVPAVLHWLNGDDRISYGASRETRDGKAFFLPTATISPEDRFEWNGNVAEVSSVRPFYNTDQIMEHKEADFTVVEGWLLNGYGNRT